MSIILAAIIAHSITAQLGEATRIYNDGKAIERIIQDSLKQWDAPGVVAVIVHRNRVIFQQAYGFAMLGDDRTPMRIDHAFPIASCSKAFTSALMAKLVDEGVMNWDDPVRKHLPSFHVSEPSADALIDMEDLLTHRSGFGGTDHDLLWYHSPLTNQQLINRLEYLPSSSPFRTQYQYSSLMFLTAGEAMANRSRISWEQLVLDKICKPIGMNKTFCDIDKQPRNSHIPQGYRRSANSELKPMPLYHATEPNPSGSVHTTAHDLALWMRFHLNNGIINGNRIISSENLQYTKTPHVIMPQDKEIGPYYPISNRICYAMGWVSYDYHNEQVLAHGGVSDGYRTQITLLPKYQLGIALMNNLHKTKMNIAITNNLIDAFIEAKPRDWDRYFLDNQSAEDISQIKQQQLIDEQRTITANQPIPYQSLLLGTYNDPAYGTVSIKQHGQSAMLQWNGWSVDIKPYRVHQVIIDAPDTPLDQMIVSLRPGQKQYDSLQFLGQSFYRSNAKP